MALIKYVQNTFNSGETGPYFSARADLQAYRNTASKIENFTCLPQGGADHRRGLEFVRQLSVDDPDEVRFAMWDFNSEQQYLVAFIDEEIQIYRDKVFVATIVSPYEGEDVRDLRFAQSGDVMVIVHPYYEPRGLERQGSDSSWVLGTLDFDKVPAYRYNTAQTMTPSGTSGAITLTLSPTDAYFTADHVGVNIYVNGGVAKIISVTNGYTVAATTSTNLGSTAVSNAWKEDLWSTAKGFPRSVTFHQDRLWFGGVRDAPNAMAASVTADFFNFETGSDDDDALVYTISSDQVQNIRDIKSQGGLNVFTSEGQFIVRPTDDPVTPGNINVDQQGKIGVYNVPVNQVDNEIIFIVKNGREIRSWVYDYASNSYVTDNKTKTAHHLFDIDKKPLAMAFLQSYRDTQSNMMFVPRSDGELAVLTIDTPAKVLAWSRFVTDGAFHDACVVATDHGDGNQIDTLYLLVERENGIFIEAMTELAVYLDNYHYGNSVTAKPSWFGINSLVGQTVRVVADGFVIPPLTVTYKVSAASIQAAGTGYEVNDVLTAVGGTGEPVQLRVSTVGGGGAITGISVIEPCGSYTAVPGNPVAVTGGSGSSATFNLTSSGGFTLPKAANDVYVGLEYTAELETMDFDVAMDGSSLRGEQITKKRAIVKLLNTLSLTVDQYPIIFRQFGPALLDQPLVPFSGQKEKRIQGISRTPTVRLRVTEPLPCTVLALTTELSVPR